MSERDIDTSLREAGEHWRANQRTEPPSLTALLGRPRSVVANADLVPGHSTLVDAPFALSPSSAHQNRSDHGQLEVEATSPADLGFPGAVTPRPWARRRGWVAAAAAAVVVLAIAIPTVWRAQSRSAAPAQLATSAPPHPTNAAAPATTETNKLLAAQAVSAAFARQSLPNGAHPAAAAPVPGLAAASGINYESLGMVDESRWWTLSGSYEASLQYFTAHPPRGMSKSISILQHGAVPSISPEVAPDYTTSGTTYIAVTQSPAYSNLTLSITVAADGSASAIRIDVQAQWTVVRPVAEHIASPVASVLIVFSQQGPVIAPARTPAGHTITGTDAQHLADIVNGLPVANTRPGTGVARSASFGSAALFFHTAAATIEVDYQYATASVTFPGGPAGSLPLTDTFGLLTNAITASVAATGH